MWLLLVLKLHFFILEWKRKKQNHLDWNSKGSGDKKQQRFHSQVLLIFYLQFSRFSSSIDEGVALQQTLLVAKGNISWVSYFQPQISESGVLTVSPTTAIFCFCTSILFLPLTTSSPVFSTKPHPRSC